MTVITVAQAREGLVKAIAERGEDFVYERIEHGGLGGVSCKYAVLDKDGNDCPSCIVGTAINYIDPALFAILVEEESEQGGMSAMNIQTLDFEPEALWALQAAQKAQDNGSTWGRSLEQFDRYIAGELNKYDVEP